MPIDRHVKECNVPSHHNLSNWKLENFPFTETCPFATHRPHTQSYERKRKDTVWLMNTKWNRWKAMCVWKGEWGRNDNVEAHKWNRFCFHINKFTLCTHMCTYTCMISVFGGEVFFLYFWIKRLPFELTYFGMNMFKVKQKRKQVNPSNPGGIEDLQRTAEAHCMAFVISNFDTDGWSVLYKYLIVCASVLLFIFISIFIIIIIIHIDFYLYM